MRARLGCHRFADRCEVGRRLQLEEGASARGGRREHLRTRVGTFQPGSAELALNGAAEREHGRAASACARC